MKPLDAPALATEKMKSIIGDFRPDFAVILGSGLSQIAELCTDIVTIPYADIPGFPEVRVEGHVGELVFGTIGQTKLCFFKGRVHFYEGDQSDYLKTMIRSIKLLGCDQLIITAAVGSLKKDLPPGSVVMINDHINMMGFNPLVGMNQDKYGPRFLPLDNAWSSTLRHKVQDHAQKMGMDLPEGVYVSVLGPTFETPAEIKMFQSIGADVVGMSTVPDCLIAHHCGMQVLGFAIVVNYGTGMVSGEIINHDRTLQDAAQGREKLIKLLKHFFKSHI